MHAGQLRYHDFTLLREAREQRRLRQQLSSAHSPISTKNIFGTSKLAFSVPATSARFFGGLSSSSSSLNNGTSSQISKFGAGSPLAAGGRGGLLASPLGGGGNLHSTPAMTLPTTWQQNRAFLTSLRTNLHLKSLERVANASPSDVHAAASPLGGGGNLQNAPAMTLPTTRQQIQNRTFLTSLRTNLHLKSLERVANASPSDVHAQHEFLSELGQHYPEAVVARFENYKEFAVDERVALLYLNALQRCGGARQFGLKRFVERL
eukprot:CAMPEP_0172574926 /NCGR_PEP_ID=MMETSP1067-20121228/136952_1 /TAXON_ID=265564 ORGANISM="Thalassiosira punctigera, Strain Tpunct2005C2" /NCGR_SAMPLE_ID=MMETSP1067 /ASSEMBLY_ACC=CAM_ASM_000444 /LENGTH=262 /DNA_ID=CAMNT_0013367563 /DNA_START=90 /DNA_END=874 /DNA_ORIENTATION=+